MPVPGTASVLPSALSVGALALAGIGHVAGIGQGLVASALVVAGLLAARHRPARYGR